jgi:acyl-CoA dehydrogenase
MNEVLELLLRERIEVPADSSMRDYWERTRSLRERFATPVDRALSGGRAADRLGYAFAAGYVAAVHALVPALPKETVAGFSVSEQGGNHPRAITTRLERVTAGYVLSGAKRWSTMGPLADELIVVAKAGDGPDGRPLLSAVRVDPRAPGLTLTEMAPTPFVPEVPHAELRFDRVAVPESAVLPGDGYADYTKPFRTVEDIHVNAALIGYLLSVAARYGWPGALLERLAALAVAVRALATLDARRAETHVALAGLLDQMESVGQGAEASWALVREEERERWHRDRVLTQVASKARNQRRERALAALHGEESA